MRNERERKKHTLWRSNVIRRRSISENNGNTGSHVVITNDNTTTETPLLMWLMFRSIYHYYSFVCERVCIYSPPTLHRHIIRIGHRIEQHNTKTRTYACWFTPLASSHRRHENLPHTHTHQQHTINAPLTSKSSHSPLPRPHSGRSEGKVRSPPNHIREWFSLSFRRGSYTITVSSVRWHCCWCCWCCCRVRKIAGGGGGFG